jgi:hypothetical protein
MGTKMITCAICNGQVSKRQSLLIEPYGRICRNHPEVEQHKAKLAETADKMRQDKRLEEAMKNLQVMTVVEQIRMTAKVTGKSLDFVLMIISYRLPKSIREEVRKLVYERGPVSDKEMGDAINMAAYMAMNGWFRQDGAAVDPEPTELDHGEKGLGGLCESLTDAPDALDDPEGVLQETPEYRLPLWLVEPKKFENGKEYKYVRFADGKVLFAWAGDMYFNHKMIVDCGYTRPVKEGDKLSGMKPPAVSAGKIKVRNGGWTVTDSGSMTAKLPRCESDEKFIQAELGPKWTENVEAGY